MTNKELQTLLQGYPDDMPVKLLIDHEPGRNSLINFTDENLLHTSETAFADDSFPEDEWDCEDGKIVLGNGQQYLLINPIVD